MKPDPEQPAPVHEAEPARHGQGTRQGTAEAPQEAGPHHPLHGEQEVTIFFLQIRNWNYIKINIIEM